MVYTYNTATAAADDDNSIYGENGKFVVQFKGSISVPVLKPEAGNGEQKPDQLQICVNQASYIFRAAR